MQAAEVVNHIPVPAIRSVGTASGINDSAEAEVRHALGLANGAAARQPARARRRSCGAETPAEDEHDDRWSVVNHFDLLAQRAQSGPGRQGGRIYTNGV